MDNLNGWSVEKHDTPIRSGGKICGTRVTSPEGRIMDWAGRMTKRDAIRQTVEYWRVEAVLNDTAPLHYTGECGNVCSQCGLA